MNLAIRIAVAGIVFCAMSGEHVFARGGGFTGGGGHVAAAAQARGGGGGGAARAAAARPASRPSAPNLGGGHAAQRPNIERPSASRPAVSRPQPNQPVNRPAVNRPNVERPNVNRPAIDRPTGNRPEISRPSNRPSGGMLPNTRPSLPTTRPTPLPGVDRPGSNRPNIERPSRDRPVTLPATRPSIPDLGNGAITRPGQTRPSLPGGENRPGVTRPSVPGGENRPGITRPSRPGGENRPGVTRPNLPEGVTRPSPGDLGDFLGMDRPLRPGTDRPSIDRPSIDRPGIDRPGLDRPGTDRPGITRPERPNLPDRPGTRPSRPGVNDRPINIGNINGGRNNVINSRPAWVNINQNQINIIGNRWQGQLGGIHNWRTRYPNRVAFWNGWGNGIRTHWRGWRYHPGWFGPTWWNNHRHFWGGWHYGFWFNRRPWGYWWTFPAFNVFNTWFTWTAPAASWTQPVFYDYGQGGNVVYQDNSVFINGEQVATADEFAESAMELATVEPPADEAAAEAAEWMALGTFAISSDEQDVDPSRVIQLAVDRQGVISGTLFNTQTDEAKSVQGQVDKDTQRVAFRIGDSEDVVVETGLYNLTQEEAPALVHFGTKKTENWLLVRMENPEEEESTAAKP